MRLTILDTGAGNLHSLLCALGGLDVRLTRDPTCADDGDLLLLPGVGAFGPAATFLAPALPGLRRSIASGLPVIGICLGMQLLFEASEEGGGEGLGVLAGKVERLAGLRVPHMGWNEIEGLPSLRWGYFAHAYACAPRDAGDVVAFTAHEGVRVAAAVRRGRVAGLQFHPEKSGAEGRAYLRALIEEVTS